MTDRWILAVDLGNGGPKVAAVAPTGEILASSFRAVDVRIGLDGSATQDAGQWWSALCGAIRDLGVDSAGLQAIGITGQWGSTVPVDSDGLPVGDVLLWADTRAGKLSRQVVGGPVSVSGFAPHKVLPFVRLTGGAPTPSGADPTGHSLLLQAELPEVYARARWLMEPVDYLGMRMTGVAAATPASMILSWLTDNRLSTSGEPVYVDDLVRRARRDPARLPPLSRTGSVLGTLLPVVAEEFGLAGASDVPVVCGIPDLHAATLGSGAMAPFETHLAISTTAWLSARVPFKRTDVLHSIATVPGLEPTHPLVANNLETGGGALRWWKEQVLPDTSYDDLTALAATAPAGCEGVLFTPWLNGERSPLEDKRLRAAFLNVSLRTDRATLTRAVMEGVAHNVGWLMTAYSKFLKAPVTEVRILGGGAQSALWCQIHSDILGTNVAQVADPINAQLRGVALWTLVATGELRLQEVGARVPVAQTFSPQPEHRTMYDEIHREYVRLPGTLKGLYHRLNPL